jgi:hypothetical protein
LGAIKKIRDNKSDSVLWVKYELDFFDKEKNPIYAEMQKDSRRLKYYVNSIANEIEQSIKNLQDILE